VQRILPDTENRATHSTEKEHACGALRTFTLYFKTSAKQDCTVRTCVHAFIIH